MLKLYSAGEMERYIRGNNANSLNERVETLMEFPLEFHGIGFASEYTQLPNDSVVINDFGEDGREYILDKAHLIKTGACPQKHIYMSDDRGLKDSFHTMSVPFDSSFGAEAQEIMRFVLEKHGLDSGLLNGLDTKRKFLLHQHVIRDESNDVTYNFYLPSKSEVRKLEHLAMLKY